MFDEDGLMLTRSGHEVIARQVLRVLSSLDPKIDVAAVEKKKSKKSATKKAKARKFTGLAKGTKSQDLIEIQRRLVKLGYEIDPAEIKAGKFGETTETAVKQFQTINDLSVTGKLSEKDVAAIKATSAKSYGLLAYMAKSLVNKPEETPEDKDKSEDDEEVSYVRSATGEYDAEITDDIVTQAAAILRSEESFSAKPGWDVNNWRVGFGSSTVTDQSGVVSKLPADRSNKPNITVSKDDALRDLTRRLETEFIPKVMAHASGLSDGTIAALVSVAYNYGSLPNNVVTAMKTKNTDKIAQSVLQLSTHNGGINARRREKEAAYILNSN
jgi:GH24 family phage-related lysozyme (muramidase)